MRKVTEEVLTVVDGYHSFSDWNVFIYRFAVDDQLKNKLVEDVLNNLLAVCDYQLLDSLENNFELHPPNTVALFLVTSISDFEVLRELNYPESVPKIMAYYFTLAEFEVTNDVNFRRPFKARSFYLIYPDMSTDNIIHPCQKKILDTLYVRTVRNKFCKLPLGQNIEAYMRNNPQSVIADMREVGLYLQHNGLNHCDNFAGSIAIRLGSGFLINASKTDKSHFGSDDVCYVENYFHEKNEIEFVGGSMPSSESLVPHLVFKEFPQMNIMVHFHYKPMTYSTKLDFYRTDKYVSYGTLEEAETIRDKLRETNDFVIAYGHGEFIFARDFFKVKKVIDKIQKLLIL